MTTAFFRTSVSLLCLLSFPLQAETIPAASQIKHITLYPWGASILREISVDLPAGVHDLIIADLPLDTPAETLQVKASTGLTIGAVNLAYDRLLPQPDQPTPEIAAAEAEVKRTEAALRTADANIAAIRLKSAAANEQVAFLRGLGQTDGASGTVEDLRALSRMVGEESLAALQTAHQAEQDAQTAELARADDIKALEAAQTALAALTTGEADHAALTMAVESAGGPAVIAVTTFSEAANWQPVYDLRLTTGDAPALSLDRAVLVSQSTGEDWMGVNLTLSTARPGGQSTPGTLRPDLRRIGPKQDDVAKLASEAAGDSMVMMEAPAPAVASFASAEMMGATVTYSYPNTVDIRDGVESLRLRLDTLALAPKVVAQAVPRVDQTAFLMAEFTNTSPEILLPGSATLFLDGTLTGLASLPLLAAGAETEVGFGPIDSLRLTRTVPERSEGDTGMISVSTEINEVALLGIENLTAQDWAVKLLDQVPYSEQDDLEISYTATPPATDQDMEGQRGLLEWAFDLKAGEKTEIKLETQLSWPEGQVLQ
ncbi:MAG: DUF4139 domain-containing protein [Paracoccaceae bacterium]